MVKETTDSAKVNLVDVLKEIRGGDFLFEASGDLEKVIAGVRETCKPGKLVLTLKIEPLSKGDVSSVRIVDDSVTKIPKPDKKISIFFTSDDNRLLRDDPRQLKFNMKA